MNIALIIGILIVVLIIGHVVLRRKHSTLLADKIFAEEYREWYYKLRKKYYQTYVGPLREGELHGVAYEWLIKNAPRMQYDLRGFGLAQYGAIRRYEVVTNTIPKYRNNSITEEDANLIDDCMLRYLGNWIGELMYFVPSIVIR